MTFVNLVMLAGLAGVAVPLVLHLLSRARYRTIDWGAMMFLLGADRRQRRNMRLRQWLLLAIRMLLVAVIALALARPRLARALPGKLAGGNVAVVVIIDRSGSMAVRENAQPRMDAAKAAAIRILKQLNRSDEVTLLRTGDNTGDAGLSADLPALARQIADMQPAQGAADMALALGRAMDVLDRSQAPNRELYVIADRQQSSWSTLDRAWAAAWHKRLSAHGPVPRIFYVPVGGQETANLAVVSVELGNPPLVVQQPAEIEVRVQNFGSVPAADVPLELKEDARSILRTSLTLAPGASTVVRAQTTFARQGAHVLTASITSTGFTQDDSRELALWVGAPIPTLVISGDERDGAFRRESDFLRLALEPWKTAGKPGADPVAVTVVSSDRWPPLDVSAYPALVLANVAQLSEAQAREVEQYVYSGGGLLITAGSLLQTDSYNRLLYRGSTGILPAQLGDAFSPRASERRSILGLDLAHPALHFARNRPDPVPVASILRHLPVSEIRPEARTLITLDDGEPLLLEYRAGRGRVLLLTSSIDADWNSLPLTGFYLPFAQSLVRYLAAGQLPQLNITTGSPIILQLRTPVPPSAPVVVLPDGRRERAVVVTTPVATELRYADTAQPGRYTLVARWGGEERRWIVAAMPPASESDLTPLSAGRLDEIEHLADLAVLRPDDPNFDELVGKTAQGTELWLPLLLAALLLGILELVVARLWTKGAPVVDTAGAPSSDTGRAPLA